MNSTQRMVIDVLALGPQPAANILGALALRGWKRAIEFLYVELVEMEAAELVRVEASCINGQRVGSNWALGRKSPKAVESPTTVADMLSIFGRPTDEFAALPAGVLVHRCL